MNSAQKNSPVSLVENRNTERTLGCVGFSIFAHVALLAALAVAPNSIRELGASDRKTGTDDTVSMVDASENTESTAKGATPLTDAASDVVMSPEKEEPQPVVEKHPVVKQAFAKPAKPAKAAAPNTAVPVMTDETAETEAMPTLLANPPGDGESSDAAAQEESSSSDDETTAPSASAPIASPPVAVAATATADDSTDAEDTPVAATKPSVGSADGGGSPGAVVGPIRDASDLKALPGNSNPVYPARDRLARKEGTAVILGRVSPDGHVTELKLEKSSGSQMMDAAAVQTFRSWRFQAGQEGWVRKPFQFRLVGDAKEVPAPLGKPMTR